MSGPKGYQVSVEERARLAREIEAARSRCRALRAMIRVAEADAARLGATVEHRAPEVAGAEDAVRADLAALSSLQQRLMARLEVVESAVRDARRAAVRAHLLNTYRVSTAAAPAGATTGAASAATDTTDVHSRAAVEASLARGLERASAVDEAPRAALLALADRVRARLAAGQLAAADAALLTLQTETQRAVSQQRVVDHVRRDAGRLVADTADLTGPEADDLHSRALSCRTRVELDRVVEHALALRAAHDAERDRLYVIAQTRAALRELGYEVGEEFTELASHGDAPVIRRPDLPDHGLRIRFAPTDGRVVTNVVALAATTPQRDAEVEALTCADLVQLQQAWSERGVGSILVSHRAAGERPVERAEAGPSQPVRRAPKGRTLG